jgi:phosphatidylethanolamine-binding protein (PEBP) family uncharacterized protein
MHPIDLLLRPLGWAFRNRRAGETGSLANASELATPNHIDLSSPNFRDGGVIPAKHCGKFIGQDISPALTWGTLPAKTTDLVLMMEDLDSPGKAPRIHTIAAFPATAGGLAEGALAPNAPGIRFLPSQRGPGKYAGPRPLPGHGPHQFRFHLYALETPVDLATIPDAEHLPSALSGHVLASGVVTGTRTA